MYCHGLKELARKADQSEGDKREKLLRELMKELTETSALEGVSNRALIKALEISRRFRA